MAVGREPGDPAADHRAAWVMSGRTMGHDEGRGRGRGGKATHRGGEPPRAGVGDRTRAGRARGRFLEKSILVVYQY